MSMTWPFSKFTHTPNIFKISEMEMYKLPHESWTVTATFRNALDKKQKNKKEVKKAKN